MIQCRIVKGKGRRNPAEALFSVVSFRHAGQYLDKPVASWKGMGCKLSQGPTGLFFLPVVAIMGSHKEKGLLRHSPFDTPQVLALLFPDGPWATEAGRETSWHRPEDEGPKVGSCPLQLSQVPSGSGVRSRAQT